MPSDLTLTVTPSGRVYPHRALCRALHLKGGQPIDCIPPRAKGGGRWLLDLRPEGITSKLSASEKRRPAFNTAYAYKPGHFELSGGRGKPRRTFTALTFELGEPIQPLLYTLRRVAA